MQGFPWRKLFIVPFLERFQTTALGKFYWYIFSLLGKTYLSTAFLPNSCWWKVMYRGHSTLKGASYCSFCTALQNNYFGKEPLITSVDTLKKILKDCICTDSLLIVNYIQGVLRKELLICPFAEPLKTLFLENLNDHIASTWNN